MKSPQIALVVASAALLANGCGTICNLATGDPKVPLGGVQTDLEAMPKFSQGLSSSSNGKSAVALLAILSGEMALSAIGDTLTLPLALYLIKRAGCPPPDPDETANPPPSSGKVFSTAIVGE